MKTLKYILSAVLLILILGACTKNEFGSVDFVSTAKAPENISALFDITQDNSGLVTITPSGVGANSYAIYFGDLANDTAKLKPGEFTTHTYLEGSYNVGIVAYGITGLKTEVSLPLVVSFKAPENLEVSIVNDLAVSKQVNVTATADYAVSFDVYFGEAVGEEPVTGNIGTTVSHVYQEIGTYTIRVVAKGGAIQTTEYTEDFVVTAILQPVESAPTPPARNAVDVISIYGDAYTNVAGTNFNPDWGQSGQGSSFAEFDLNGDMMLQYINLSYQGIEFASAIDASSMEYLHLDVWTADVELLDIFPISSSTGEKSVQKALTADTWNSIDIPLSDFTDQGLSVADLIQFKLVGTPWAGGTVFIDNIYFYVSTPSAPITAAPVPTNPASTVTSIFSDSYTNITVNEWNPGWGQSTILTEVVIDGNNTLKYEALNYTGIVTDYTNPTDLTNRTHVHFDYWTNDASSLSLKLVNTVLGQEDIKDLSTVTIGSWVSVNIPLSDYAVDVSAITQILFQSSGATVYIDNLYFYTQLPAAPTTAAPTPTAAAGDVISVYSDAYTPITSTEWNPGWGQTTILTEITLESNNTLKYEALNYTGIVLDYSNPTDVSGKTYVHFDYWTNDATSLGFKLVNTNEPDGPTKEYEAAVSPIGLGVWASADIPLSEFTTNLTGITQLLFSSSSATVYIDNLYFY